MEFPCLICGLCCEKAAMVPQLQPYIGEDTMEICFWQELIMTRKQRSAVSILSDRRFVILVKCMRSISKVQ